MTTRDRIVSRGDSTKDKPRCRRRQKIKRPTDRPRRYENKLGRRFCTSPTRRRGEKTFPASLADGHVFANQAAVAATARPAARRASATDRQSANARTATPNEDASEKIRPRCGRINQPVESIGRQGNPEQPVLQITETIHKASSTNPVVIASNALINKIITILSYRR